MGVDRPIDITEEQRKTILTLLDRHLPNTTAWAYGSRVRWTSRPQSDLDMVVFAKPEQKSRVADLREAFEESNLPFRVDLFVWDTVPEEFRGRIEAEHVVLVEAEENYTYNDCKKTVYGSFPIDFSESSLEDICAENSGVQTGPFGSQLHKKDYVEFGTPIITVEHLCNNRILHDKDAPKVSELDRQRLLKYSLRIGDIVFSRVGSVDRCALVRKSEAGWLFSGRCLRIRLNPNKIDSAYLSYFFGLPSFQKHIRAIAVGATMPSLNTKLLSNIKIFYPTDLHEQRAIAHILSTLDDKIELNRRMNKTLEEMARALFKDWFVDFGPVRAKMEGRWRPGESLPGLPAHLYDLFPDRLVDSELGEIPEGWEVRFLGEMVELNPSEHLKRGIVSPYLNMAALPTSGPSPDEPVLRKFKSGTRFRNGDVLLARITPCLENGKTAFIQALSDHAVGWGSTEFIVMRAVSPIPPEYPYLLARDAAFREHAIQSMTGTSGRQRVQVHALAHYLIPSPRADLWRKFSSLMKPVFGSIEATRKESCFLAAQRDVLLPKLISGKLRIK